MPDIFFSINGQPKGKGRPRMTRSGHCYTPENTREYERKVSAAAKGAMRDRDAHGHLCEVVIQAYGWIYPSWSMARKGKCYGEPCDSRPDIDNITKAILDGANGVVWKDDCQVWSLQAIKLWDDDPRVEVSVHWEE